MIAPTKLEHATKAQLYRWFNGYERYFTASRITNQLALLAEDIIVTTPRESIAGKANYAKSLKEYKGMKIAHTIEEIKITTKINGRIEAEIHLIYHGVQRDGTDNCLRFIYKNELAQIPNQLPVFKNIQLAVEGAFQSPPFTDSYPRLRALALMHYYLFLIERLQENAVDFQEILIDGFQLKFSPTTIINSIETLNSWLKKVRQKVAITSHYPKNVSVKTLALDRYELTVDFDWEGWTITNQKMTAQTRHTWLIIDKKNDRFAKIQAIEVAQLVSFSMA
ncbi:MAG: hypothetical protein AB8G86_30370 [Saprospiraceae bacterium]